MYFLKDEELISEWKLFFQDNYKNNLETISLSYPLQRSLQIDYDVLDKACPNLADSLIDNPSKNLFNAEEAVKTIDTTTGKIELHIRLVNLPEHCRIRLNDIRGEHVGKMMSVTGLVKKRTKIQPTPVIATFQCLRCGAIIREEQTPSNVLVFPKECYKKQGGCERISNFKYLREESEFIDMQKIQLQNTPDGLQDSNLTVILEDDLVDQVRPGDTITVNGILSLVHKMKGSQLLKQSEFIMNACSIEHEGKDEENIVISEEDEKKIKTFGEDPELMIKIRNCIAPSIFGLPVEKMVLALQLFGGVPVTGPDGTYVRGDIHVLMFGDPGLAKSQLLHNIAQISPRSVLCSGTGASGVGLTAAVVRDDFGGGKWMLEGGSLVLADKGIACIDELDKMNDEDRENMHTAMEQQIVTIAKAGINASLNTRCSILAAANPKEGFLDDINSIVEQIGLKPALISRFDVILPFVDEVKTKQDKMVANHILSMHSDSESVSSDSVVDIKFLRKYIFYAKQNYEPKLTAEARKALTAFYMKIRQVYSTKTGLLTPRLLQTVTRVSQAVARMRLSEVVSEDDAKKSVALIHYFLMKIDQEIQEGMVEFGSSSWIHELEKYEPEVVR